MATFTPNPNLRAQMGKAIDRGLDAAVAVLSARLQAILSQPGTGRVYLIGKPTEAKSGKTYMKASARQVRKLRKLGITPRSTRGGKMWITQGEAQRVWYADQQAAAARGGKQKTLRQLRLHRASAPGQPPAADTGNLKRSWQMGGGAVLSKSVSGNRRVYRLGSAARYARRLEFGGTDSRGVTILPRPYIRPLIANHSAEAVEAFRATVAGTIAAGAVATVGRAP